MLRTACLEAAAWTQPLTVAVNVSAVQLYNTNFVQELHQILLETGLPPRRLEIEITETALVRDFNRALTTLRQIKALGVRIAMDDWDRLPRSRTAGVLDKIKIDGSSSSPLTPMVRPQRCQSRPASVAVSVPVLAEGVETEAELQRGRA